MGIKRMGKKKREMQRAANAKIFEQGFNHGYQMGYEQGYKEAAEKGRKEAVKWAGFGR